MSINHPSNLVMLDSSIKNIYKIQEISRMELETVPEKEDVKGAIINIFNSNNQINSAPIIRFYYGKKDLINSPVKDGKVVEHVQCYYYEKYRTFGLGSKINEREKSEYKKNNFLQIHVNNASADGIVVWRRLGFQYVDENADRTILGLWYSYLTDELKLNETNKEEFFDIISKTKTIKNIKKEYLYHNLPNGKKTFIEWYANKVNQENSEYEISTQMFYNLYEEEK
jgi:hypothetical protein